jgi:hypothetical protein
MRRRHSSADVAMVLLLLLSQKLTTVNALVERKGI